MSVFAYKKFKIALQSDSKKTQGLRVGDIVRRQYFDGTSTIYSLMCVLETGTDANQKPYFIGALLEGDEPHQNELLDFVRVTSLFDTDRSGALYLTASDSEAPYMDVIDGIGKNESLSWPVNTAIVNNPDSQSQYILEDASLATAQYIKSLDGNSRVLHLTRNESEGTLTLKQDFYKYVANPNRVLISYKIKASKEIEATTSLEYVDGVRVDGSVNVNVGEEWSYQLHAITVDWSGRHLRSVKIELPDLDEDDEVWIADFNIILLSSIAQFGDGSQIRVGKLDGITDPVFGKLNGYGGYLQKMFSSGSAHISGTLTAGDENGFGSTFYAGKIHRNVFINSLEPNFADEIEADTSINSPTGIGSVYRLEDETTVVAQTREWYGAHIGQRYCLSFWIYANNPCQIAVKQNNFLIGTIQVDSSEIHSWQRHSVSFEILAPTLNSEALDFTLVPEFDEEEADAISTDPTVIAADTLIQYEDSFMFAAPQLESGSMVSQYQATDEVLNETEDYGAWFNRGGIGGTIQNPLLKLNFDGQGSIGTRTNSFLLRLDGSGYLANANISWDEDGQVVFGENVQLNWNNFSTEVQNELKSKSVKIVGNNTMVVIKGGNSGLDAYSPATLNFGINVFNFTLAEATYQWQYLTSEGWEDIEGETDSSIEITPQSDMWDEDDCINLRIVATVSNTNCYDSITLRKLYVAGYTVEITSENGTSFHNGSCQTTLKAQILYRGTPITDYEGFAFMWHKYTLPDVENEDTDWYQEQVDDDGEVVRPAIDRTASEITLDYVLGSQDYFVCTVSTTDMFTYDFPISF